MSGDLRNPSKAIPKGTLYATLTTSVAYILVIVSMAASTGHGSLLRNANIIQDTNLYAPTILAGELAVTFFSALMGIVGASKLMQALARDKLFPGLSLLGRGLNKGDEPVAAIFLTYVLAQIALLADLDQLASLISIFYQVSHVFFDQSSWSVNNPVGFGGTLTYIRAPLETLFTFGSRN